MGKVSVNYGTSAIGVTGGVTDLTRRHVTAGSVPVPGSGVALEPTVSVNDQRDGFCEGNDGTCRARPAKGTEWCIGHLRSIQGVQRSNRELED